jgi:[acyl-carrier-protein] S-malonyltransferase
MAEEMISAYPQAASLYKEAEEITGIDLTRLTGEELAQTRYSQLAIVVHSVASLMKERSENPESESSTTAYAGFSLGEYTALFAAGVLPYPKLLRLVNERARIMQEAAEKTPGAMYAILGLTDERVESALSAIDDVYPVNYNCPGQLVIAGTEAAAEQAAAELLALGARRAMRLSVNGAFHSPLMAVAAGELREFASTLEFAPLSVPLYSNATGGRVLPDTDWPSYLEAHACSPVRFTKEIRTMREDGYDEFVEIGPGKVLTGLVKKI